MTKVRDDAVLAIYLDKDGQELQREVLTPAAKQRELQDPDPSFIDPWNVTTVDINCLSEDRPVFGERLLSQLGPAEVVNPTLDSYYTLQKTDDSLRYVFDSMSHQVPLQIFAQVIKTLTKEKPSRCQTVKMVVCGGCVFPCRPKICNSKATCGFHAGCPCP